MWYRHDKLYLPKHFQGTTVSLVPLGPSSVIYYFYWGLKLIPTGVTRPEEKDRRNFERLSLFTTPIQERE